MLHASPDLDHLRLITDQALHGHHTLGVNHPPQTHVTIAAEHLDVLLRSIDPDLVDRATKAHNRDLNRAQQHTRCVTAIVDSLASLDAALTRNDLPTIAAAGRNLTRLARQLQETTPR